MGLSTVTATRWVERWEQQQQRYAFDREERFTVVADVIEHVTAHSARPLVVDLGCGPGSLAVRLSGRMPHARIVAVDMDPVLLELGRAHARASVPAAAVRYVEAVIGAEGWASRLGLDGPLDAAVSTTAMHYLPCDMLRRVYGELAGMVRPGGVLVNADHLLPEEAADIAVHVGRRRAGRQHAFSYEDWESWWAAAERDPELTDLFAERRRRTERGSGGNNGLTLNRHAAMLRDAGFRQVGPVWQVGNSCVLVAVR
ncbi:class I SAM-dependent methyltransferase [Streptomyces sp. NRRL F-5126]|uniref:class I SAM-dependent methyltransferase n=1 Tax=Streptomyces sp. NRRL F-5126 TaxID=1463857 RepID=UPI0004CA62A1|nr:class I SAM-dependent methyltransferase [Streptomyces sp. NRRL F-5126]